MNTFAGRRAVLVTQHGKERALGPLFAELGVTLEVEAVDTDVFGTFDGERPREGGPLEAARRKLAAGMAARPDQDLFVASEGSFGPHPSVLLCAADHELVVLLDRRTQLELTGEHVTFDTNHGSHKIRAAAEARAVGERLGLPTHAALVRARGRIEKGLFSLDALEASVERLLADADAVTIEADLRAMCNPRRMRAIAQAGYKLVEAARALCPHCGRPGFVPRDVRRGVPCEDCGTPTRAIAAEVIACDGCGAKSERPRAARVSPRWCDVCNP